MATTTNYGWTTPDDTALVKDGASAIRSLGSSIDTTTKALNPSTTLGDIEYRSSTANTNTRLAIGTSGQGLTVVAGVPSWAPSATSVLSSTGDLLYASAANTLARLNIGTSNQVLTVSGGLPVWATPAASTPANGMNSVTTNQTTTSTSFTDLGTVGPSVTLTTGTKALVIITSYLHNSTNSTLNWIGFDVSGATTISASESVALMLSNTSTGNARPELQYTWAYVMTGLTAGSNTFTLKYKCSGGTLRAAERYLSVKILVQG